jgi:sulfotransferase family protein
MRVMFLIVGAQKAGTTALHRFLSAHPQLGMPHIKEAHWFDNDRIFKAGSNSEWLYHSLFPTGPEIRFWGEATPAYMYVPLALVRIHQYNPKMKLIVILRDPSERAWSHYRMVHDVLHNEPLPFLAAIEAEPVRLMASAGNTAHGSPFRRHAYVTRGLYASQLQRLLTLFPREQQYWLQTEDLRTRHDEELRRIYTFLGVAPEPIPPSEIVFSQGEMPMPPGARRLLVPKFLADIAELERLTGWDLTAWRWMD